MNTTKNNEIVSLDLDALDDISGGAYTLAQRVSLLRATGTLDRISATSGLLDSRLQLVGAWAES